MQNIKRKRGQRTFSAPNPDGNYTPSDSDSDTDDEQYHPVQRKIVKIELNESNDSNSLRNGSASNLQIDRFAGGDSSESSQSSETHSNHGNNQLLLDALRKLQELENELAELDEADYDSGHHDDDDQEADEGHASDFDENNPAHNHRHQINDADAEALGFAFCVKETFEYLATNGVTEGNPIVTALRNRFLGKCNEIPLN